MSLASVIATYNDVALEGLTSKGLLRRALRDFEAGKASVVEAGESAAQVNADGHTVSIDERGPAEARCTCPAQKTCRHILLAVLVLRGESGDEPLDATAAFDYICALEQSGLEKFAGTDWAKAVALSADPDTGAIVRDDPNVTVTFRDLKAAVTFIGDEGLRKAVYKGTESRRRLLVTLGALLVRAAHGVEFEGGSTTVAAPAVSEAFLRDAQHAVEKGVASVLPGRTTRAHDIFFDVAISTRVESLPRLSSELRVLARQARKAADRNIGFEPDVFLKKAARAYALLEALKRDPSNTQYTGTLRREYQPHDSLNLWMLGAALWRFDTGSRGVTAYAYAPSEQRWHTVSDGRAAGADPAFSPANVYAGPLWAAGTLEGLLGKTVRLPEPQVSGDGAIARNLVGEVTGKPVAFEDLLKSGAASTNWPVLRAELAGRFGSGLRRRAMPQPALLAPAGYGGFDFNDLDQVYEWEAVDRTGDRLILSIPGDAHETARQLRQLGRRIHAILTEVTVGAYGLTFRPVTVFTGNRATLDIFNIDFDVRQHSRGLEKAKDKLADFLAGLGKPVSVPPDALRAIVAEALDAVVAVLGNSPVVHLDKIQARCEAAGLVALSGALRALGQQPSVGAALKASYVAGEIDTALLFN